MTPERGERIYSAFQAALGCDPGGRAALLDGLCAGDPEVRAKVELLLVEDGRAARERFLTPPFTPEKYEKADEVGNSPGPPDEMDGPRRDQPGDIRGAAPVPSDRPRAAATHRAGAGRDLLFGLLALQNDFIDRDALLGAFASWVADRSRSLGQILRDRGALDDDCHALLEALVRQHLKRHGGIPEESLAALRAIGPVRHELEQFPDPDLHASLGCLPADRASQNDADDTNTFVVSPPASPGSRFRRLRWHAKGGLGEVFIAHDEELHREVALKQIQHQYADDPRSRARFLVEAEITGRLEHPGVVPVYGLGCDPSGRPFYAMRFVKGESLKEAIARFHGAEGPGRDPRERTLASRRLLGRFVAVCNAIAYAHSRGVIHRDLKPANILLGPFGETLVIDWGLAKVVGRAESIPHEVEATLRPALTDGSGKTQPGSAVGTPAFMSPEQAAGRLDEFGPANDVYSLGATLYHLLTGRPPIEDEDVGRALLQAQRGEFPPPRSLNPAVEPALEAICLKAMALKPGDRYPSPRELANDIEVILASDYEKLEQAHRELHEAHEDLKRTQSRLVQSSEKLAELAQVAGGALHDVNGPLGYIGAIIEVVSRYVAAIRELIALYEQAEGPLEELCPDLLDRIREFRQQRDLEYVLKNLPGMLDLPRQGLQRVQEIIANFRDIARIGRSEREDEDLNAGIEWALNIMRKRAYDKHLKILTKLAQPPPVHCVGAKIKQVLLNLLSNAFDACAEGGTVTVRTRAEDRWVRIEVTDDGCGIEPGHRDRIFDPFFTTKPVGQGTGVGLSIILDIVNDHGGRIEVESAPGQGSKFTVHLPTGSDVGRLSPRNGVEVHDFRPGSECRKNFEDP